MHDIKSNTELTIVLASSAALAIPMALQFFAGFMLSIEDSIGNDGFCYIVLVFSLFFFNMLELVVAMPSEDITLIICGTGARYVLVLYGAFGHLWHSGIPPFRSKLLVGIFMLFTVGIVLSTLYSFAMGTVADVVGMVANVLYLLGVFLLTRLAFSWIRSIREVGFDKLTASDYSCTGYIVLLTIAVYAILSIILFFQIQSIQCMYYLAVIEAVLTVLLSILKSIVDQKKLLTANIVSKVAQHIEVVFQL